MVNRQRNFDLAGSLQVSERVSLSLSIPWMAGSWSLPSPSGLAPAGPGPGPRYRQETGGVGDIGFSVRSWLLDPAENPKGNVRLGLGVEAPTGRENVHDRYPDLNGSNLRRRPADVSIQPGDGGWGGLMELHGFRDLAPGPWERNVRAYATLSYLAQPREKNRTPSIATALVGPLFVPAHLRTNSVPDIFRAEGGFAADLGAGFTAGLAARVDGVPRKDLVGGDDGFRRPGYVLAFVPTVSWTTGRTTLSVSVPRTHHVNRKPNAFGDAGDATVARWSLVLSLTVRF